MDTITATVMVITGMMTRYDPGVMETAVRNHEALGHLQVTRPYTEYVAMLDCGLLGRPVVVVWPDGKRTRHVVGDCAAAGDRAALEARGLVVEVSHEVAVREGVPVGRYVLPVDGPVDGVTVQLELGARARARGRRCR